MTLEHASRLLRHDSGPRTPLRPPLPPRLHYLVRKPLPRKPRALLFDIYGTLFMSASGDVGAAIRSSAVERFARFLIRYTPSRIAEGPELVAKAATVQDLYFAAIAESQSVSVKENSMDPDFVPEVDIREVWLAVLRESRIALPTRENAAHAALLYEAISNPVWPMPGALATLRALEPFYALGIVSNAQFYTRVLPHAFWRTSWQAIGFLPPYTAFSYEEGRAKPDPLIFDRPLASLRAQGIDSREVLYLGNDMRNDVHAAKMRGCMAALFAGDSSSLRLREEIETAAPDTVIFQLNDVPAILSNGGPHL